MPTSEEQLGESVTSLNDSKQGDNWSFDAFDVGVTDAEDPDTRHEVHSTTTAVVSPKRGPLRLRPTTQKSHID